MSLLELQRHFHAQIVVDDDVAEDSALRFDIYRNNYRVQLMNCLESVFEKTRQWVGEDSFAAAACHYILTRPPNQWTLDLYGADFDQTLQDLFRDDPEVAELAWLEWAMQTAFSAIDRAALDPQWLGSGVLETLDWNDIRFGLASGFQSRSVNTDVIRLWTSLRDSSGETSSLALDASAILIVWRKGLSPHFKLIDTAESGILGLIAKGKSFAEICTLLSDEQGADQAIPMLGAMLGRWISDGLLTLGDAA